VTKFGIIMHVTNHSVLSNLSW